MSVDNTSAVVSTTELSRAITELKERHVADKERRRRFRRNFAIVSLATWVIGATALCFLVPHLFWAHVIVLQFAYLPSLVFTCRQLRDRANRTELALARNLASFDDAAIVWPLLPMLPSLDDVTYGMVSEALIRLLGRCDESGQWTGEGRLVLQDAEKWLVNRYTRSDPELAQVVERALTRVLSAGRPTLVRSTAYEALSDGAACRDLVRRRR